MAVNVSKIPNRKDFDAVREAILQVDNNVTQIISGEGLVSDVNGITGSVNITGTAVSTNVGTNTITISANEANDGVLTLTASTGISISTPNTFSADQATNREITITNSAPDQVVTLSDSTNIDFTGTYPNFSGDLKSNVTISGTLTAGNLTTGGTLTATDVVADTGDFSTSLTINGDSVVTELIAKGAITFEGVQQISANTDTWGAETQTWETSTLPDDTTSYTILHQDTSSQADVYNTGGNVIQSIGLDTYGHVGSIGSTDLDQRYLAFKTISVGGTALEADAYNDTLSITSSDGITLTTGNDSFNIAGDDKFKFIYTSNDNKTAIPDQFNDTLTFLGSGAVSVTKSATENEIRFGLAVSDIRFEDGIRVARGFVYYVGSSETVPTATPTGSTFDFTSDLLTINDSDFSLTPPITGYNLTTYYIARFTSRDEGAGTTESRSVTYSAIEDATGFESPVTFNALTEGLGSKGFTIIDGGNIKTGLIQSIGLNRADFDAGTSIFTQRGSFIDLGSGDIVTPQFSVVSGNATLAGSLRVTEGIEYTVDDVVSGANAGATAIQAGDNISVLTNDSNFVAEGANLSVFTNDESFVQSGANISVFNNDANFVATGANISVFVNDSEYIVTGSNISELVNDANFVASGANISVFNNDSLFISQGANISVLTNDSLFVSQGDDISLLTNDAAFIASGDNISVLTNDAGYLITGDDINLGDGSTLNGVDFGALATRGTVNETYIEDGSITTDKIDAQAVTAAKIAAATITGDLIAANTILGNNIAANTIVANNIAANTITAAEVAAGTFIAADATITNSLDVADGTFSVDSVSGVITAGLVEISENQIDIGSDDATYTTKGQVRFNDYNGSEIGSLSGEQVTVGPLTLDFLKLAANFGLDLDTERLTIGDNSWDVKAPYSYSATSGSVPILGGLKLNWIRRTNVSGQISGAWSEAFTTVFGAIISKGNASSTYEGSGNAATVSYTNTNYYVDVNDNNKTVFIIAIGI